MEVLGASRVATRGQMTIPAPVRQLCNLVEGDIMEFAMTTAAELAKEPPNKTFLVAIPKRAEPIPLQTLQELAETADHARQGKALGLKDMMEQVNTKTR